MEIPNYDVEGNENNNFNKLLQYIPDRFFRMLVRAPPVEVMKTIF